VTGNVQNVTVKLKLSPSSQLTVEKPSHGRSYVITYWLTFTIVRLDRSHAWSVQSEFDVTMTQFDSWSIY